MLQLRDLPSVETLEKFAARYPVADVTAISSFLHLFYSYHIIWTKMTHILNSHKLLIY